MFNIFYRFVAGQLIFNYYKSYYIFVLRIISDKTEFLISGKTIYFYPNLAIIWVSLIKYEFFYSLIESNYFFMDYFEVFSFYKIFFFSDSS